MTKARDLADLLDSNGNLIAKGVVDGRDLATDGSKLDGIEAAATADQTDAEIRAAVEAATDSNVFTDADHTKLNAIEASATADQTNAEIRTAVESATDSNVFTDADHTKLNAIEAGATADQTKSDIDALNINADTLDGQHGSYYTGYTDTAVANIVDSSPAALNTLNELAAALGDDPNFATTTSTNIGTKLPKAGGAMTGAITTNSTFDGRNVSVDGTKLDGIEAGANVTDTANVVAALTAGSNITISAGGTIAGAAQYTHPTHAGDDASVDTGALSGATVISDLDFNITTDTLGHVTDANATVGTRNLTLANLGYTGATNANNYSFPYTISTGAGNDTVVRRHSQGYIYANFFNTTPNDVATGSVTKVCVETANDGFIRHGSAAAIRSFLNVESGATADQTAAQLLTAVKTVDGAGSGLDADTVDGLQANQFLRSDASDAHSGTLTLDVVNVGNEIRFPNNTSVSDVSLTGVSDQDTGFNWSGSNAVNYVSGGVLKYNLNNVWHSGNDGSGSGLDADTVDGLQASQFLRSDAADTMGADLSFNAGANIHRNSHSSGYFVGGYNNLGDNSTKSNPIYTIGSSYQPSDSNLDNMYGIGFSHVNAAYDGISTVLDGWGLYVASGGTARVGLSGQTGRIYGTSVVATGTMTAANFNTTSDRNTKKDIKPIENALEKVQQLGGYSFTFKTTDQKSSGVIAQEVQKVMPELVHEGDDGHLTVQYGNMVGLLIEAIKEQQAQIDELKSKLNG